MFFFVFFLLVDFFFQNHFVRNILSGIPSSESDEKVWFKQFANVISRKQQLANNLRSFCRRSSHKEI